MNKMVRIFFILTVFFLICPVIALADIVYLRNGDKHFGTLESPDFTVQTTYGNIIIRNEFLKSLTFEDGSVGRWILVSINNDRFSGTLLNESMQFIQEDGTSKKLNKSEILRIKREISGPSYPVTTTIFTMKNNDRFSGKFLNARLEIQATYMTKSVQADEINRLEFIGAYQADTKILLENGDLITGTLKQDQFRLAPDVVPELTVAKLRLKSIQFNAPKMVLKKPGERTQSGKDSDKDRIPDYADMYSDTPERVVVNPAGRIAKSAVAKIVTEKKINDKPLKTNPGQAGSRFELNNILFDFDRFEIRPEYFSILDNFAGLLRQNPDIKIEIRGHTDNVGTERYNQILSERRAGTVKNYFVERGVEEGRLFAVGFGFKINRASNKSENGRALNRRVEISPIMDQNTLVRYKP